MAEHLTWNVGNRDPSITQTILDENGDPVDLSASTVKFKMRAVGSSTLKVDQPVSNTPGSDGVVRYDWASADVNTAGQWLVWWEVTTGVRTQDVYEDLIVILDHAAVNNSYVELERLKSSVELTGTSYADVDILAAIESASRQIDLACGRRFWKDTVDSVRYYTADSNAFCRIDDVADVTAVDLDLDADGTYETSWTENTEFTFLPLNAETDGWPRTGINVESGNYLPWNPRALRVTGKHGWDAVPQPVETATLLLAVRLVKRAREAPFQVAGLGLDGVAVRVPRLDTDVEQLIAPYRRLVA